MQISHQITSKKPRLTKSFKFHSAQYISLLCRATLQFFSKLTLTCLLACTCVQANISSDWENERDLYKKALRALNNNQINQFASYKDELVDYPLYQYLVYKRLTSRISRLSDEDIDQFIELYNDGPLADRLRLKWLVQLQKQGSWQRYLKYYKNDQSTALKCYFLRAKIRDGAGQSYLSEIRKVWLVGKSQPKQCDPLFKWFKEQGHRTTDELWERFALAMQARKTSLARYLSKELPAKEKSLADLWLNTNRNPKKYLLSEKLKEDTHHHRQIVRHGIERLARKDLTQANETWLLLKEDYAFGSDLHDEVERNLALRAAYRHDARAKTWMYQLPKDVVDPSTGMWRIRSALRDLDWPLVLRGIAMLGEDEKVQSQWQYWKARALQETGLTSDANLIFEQVSRQRDYYGFLSADQLDKEYSIEDISVGILPNEFTKLEEVPAIIRTRELLLVNQDTDARREWNYITKGFTPRQLQIASALAHEWQWHDYAIRTIAKAEFFDDLSIRFPMPFTSLVAKYSKQRKLDSSLIYAIIRRESAFNERARSPVGARGLMQLMPATARQVAKQINIKSPKTHDLYQARLNISLGSRYISDMLKKFNGNRALASAAYNAGPHRVKAWLPEEYSLPGEIWVDTIPFTETREYVRAILSYTAVFESLSNQDPTRLSEYLQAVDPKP